MTVVSLQFLVLYALLVSWVLIWLNHRGASAVAAAGVTLAVCMLVVVVQVLVDGRSTPTRQAIQLWLVFILLPSLAVLGVSRVGFLANRPWFLLLIGPISFVIAVVVVATVHNLVFGARHRSL